MVVNGYKEKVKKNFFVTHWYVNIPLSLETFSCIENSSSKIIYSCVCISIEESCIPIKNALIVQYLFLRQID